MNSKTLDFIRNISYTVLSNIMALIISTLVVLIIPKVIGIEEYGFWQLYIFYSSYVGFLHFGWNDGIYLKIGGANYNDLDKKLLFSQFLQLLFLQSLIGTMILIFSIQYVIDADRGFIIQMVTVAMILLNTRLFFLFILQGTNRIKEYAIITMVEKIMYILLIILFLMVGIRDYRILIFADLIGKFISLVIAIFSCKEIVFHKISSFYLSIGETLSNISIGLKLMIANIASMLIIGIVRFGIEQTWDVTTFGKVSLTLSISNMMMIFINAVGIIMFPLLRRVSQDRLGNIYSTMRDFLMVILLGVLIFYYPMKTVISAWLPQYSESLIYMALVFPMFIYEGKMSLLINTYLKTLRKEKILLRINVIVMIISLIITYITTQIFKSVDISILSIVILLAIRSVLAEMYLATELRIYLKKDILLELFMTFIFILSGWFVNSWVILFIYGFSYFIYLLIKRSDIIRTVKSIKLLMKA